MAGRRPSSSFTVVQALIVAAIVLVSSFGVGVARLLWTEHNLRALEAAAQMGELRAGAAETDIFITPGYSFRVVDRLITNFHLPKSTLLMLVSAFSGIDSIRAAYRYAIDQRYRFFSYGDAMLLSRSGSANLFFPPASDAFGQCP